MDMTFKQAKLYMETLQKKGSIYGTELVKKLAALLDCPQNKVPVIQIVGTNGKGSVGTMLAQILAAAGYRVGRFFSPVVFEKRENIGIWQADEQNIIYDKITEDQYAKVISLIRQKLQILSREEAQEVTAFEVETVMAYDMFCHWKCDLAIVEAGLGGIQDATNIVDCPALTIITDIGYDHMELLGSTLKEIAGQKAGIIKPECPVVTISQDKECMQVIQNVCEKKQAPLAVAKEENIKEKKCCLEDNYFSYFWEEEGKISRYTLGLYGVYQMRNATLALEAVKALRKKKWKISEDACVRGLEEKGWRGRFDVLCRNPLVIADGAHNQPAAKALAASLQQYVKDRPVIAITGMFKDKSCKEVMEIVIPLVNRVYTVTPPGKRGLNAETLKREVLEYCALAESCPSVDDAVKQAMVTASSSEEYVVLVFGSLSILKEAYASFFPYLM